MNPLLNQPYTIQLFGGLTVQQGERRITRFHTYKAGALLAYLAHQAQPQSRERLIEMFWPEGTPERGRNNLSIALSSLRNQLEPPGVPSGAVIIADRLQVGLNPAAIRTDVQEFERALEEAGTVQRENHKTIRLQEAVALYAGELLPGYYEDWIFAARQRLVEAYVQALRRLIRYLLRRKQTAQALDYSLRAVAADPVREENHRDLMKVYVAAGQPSAALLQYQTLVHILDKELQEPPSPATRQVLAEIEALLQQPAPTPLTLPKAASPQAVYATSGLPGGTITFLLTDIAGFTAQWERAGEAYKEVLGRHHALLRPQFVQHGGHEFKEVGDAFLVAFERASDALLCALACQRLLAQQDWPSEIGGLHVRLALHTGEAVPEESDYHGPTLNRASRLLDAAHGGQILCSEVAASLLQRHLPANVRLSDLGLYRLRDMPEPEHLWQVDYSDMPRREFPAPNAEAGYTSHLPLTLTRFFGRENEKARLCEMLREADTRLVTLTGMGGTGKTRLALEVARQLQEPFAGAVWFVSLADLSDANLILSTLADVLRLPRSPQVEPFDQVVAFLSRQPSLVILDNFEQLVEAGPSVVQTLLTEIPALTLLLTSRQRLNLSGEYEYALQPLPVPGGTGTPEHLCLFESVQLFLDRAQAVKPDFQVTSHNAGAVATLCDKLEGIPLAIELAAARVQVLTPSQILAQLQNRFDFLTSRRRDGSDRHRTLRAAMEWSYRLLSPEVQRFFARLSVFRGGWTWEAAEQVCEEPLALDYLALLRECSLVLAEESPQGEMRFRMLETIREYACEQLPQEDRFFYAHSHAIYFLRMAELAEMYNRSPESPDWFTKLETNHDNLRAALAWSQEEASQADLHLQLVGAVWYFWEMHSHFREGQRWLETAILANKMAPPALRGKALRGLGNLASIQGNYVLARICHEECIHIWKQLNDRSYLAVSLMNLWVVAYNETEYEQARKLHDEIVTICREIGDEGRIASSMSNMGHLEYAEGNLSAAQALYEASLAISRRTGNKTTSAWSLSGLGFIACDEGNLEASYAYHVESLHLRQELGDRRGMAHSLFGFGACAASQNRCIEAHQLLAAATAEYERLGCPINRFLHISYATSRARIRNELDNNALQVAWLEGRALTLEQAIEEALSLHSFTREDVQGGRCNGF